VRRIPFSKNEDLADSLQSEWALEEEKTQFSQLLTLQERQKKIICNFKSERPLTD
jgi:hypothetical protein